MSGGSFDYLYSRTEDMADELSRVQQTPLRKAFALHLRLITKAMHDIEWVDSGDYSPGDENAAIEACLSDATFQAAKTEIAAILASIDRLLELRKHLVPIANQIVDETALAEFIEKGHIAWKDVPSAADWVEEMRGNKVDASGPGE